MIKTYFISLNNCMLNQFLKTQMKVHTHRNILIFTISDLVTIYHPYDQEKDDNLIAQDDSDCSIKPHISDNA